MTFKVTFRGQGLIFQKKINSCIGSRRSKTYDKGGGSKNAPPLEKCYLGPNRAISIIELLLVNKLHGFKQYTSLKMEKYNCHTKSCILTFSNLRQYLKRDILCFEMLFTLSFKDFNFLKGSHLQSRFHQHMSYIEFPKHLSHF